MQIWKTGWALALVGSLLLAALSSKAVPISGGIELSGSCLTDNSDLGAATRFNSFNGVTVVGGPNTSGSYGSVPDGTAVTMNGFTFNPFSGAVIPLWTFTLGGPTTYSFDLTSLNINTQSSALLELSGSGTLHITGFDDVSGDWFFQATAGNLEAGTFSFKSSNSESSPSAVPDGGTTAMLLGAALAAVGVARRYFKA